MKMDEIITPKDFQSDGILVGYFDGNGNNNGSFEFKLTKEELEELTKDFI